MSRASITAWRPIRLRGADYRVAELESPAYTIRAFAPVEARAGSPTAAMIHGMEEGWDVWEAVAAPLSARFNVVRLDMPWCGANGYGWTLERAESAEWIRRGLSLIDGGAQMAVAHSYGAMALLDYLDVAGASGIRAAALVSPSGP